MKGKDFSEALRGRRIPVLTLDNKWYRLLDGQDRPKELEELVESLNDLLKRQGKVHTETKEIKGWKKKLMGEIVPMADEMAKGGSEELAARIEAHKQLIAQCNDRLESYQDEALELPGRIEEINRQLMLLTMDICYDSLAHNRAEIEKISRWVADVRVELKKNLIRKQEREWKNQEIYTYMNDIFGPEIMDFFDTEYQESPADPQGSS